MNKCIFIASMIRVFPSNLDKIGRRNSTMRFIYLFSLIDWASHHKNHKNSSYTFSPAPRFRSTRGTHFCGSHGLSEPSSPFPIHVAQGYWWRWCFASLGSNSGLASFTLTQIALQRDPSLFAVHRVSEEPRHGWIYRKANLCCSEAPGSGALADRATLF